MMRKMQGIGFSCRVSFFVYGFLLGGLSPPTRVIFAGGKHSKRLSPPTTTASPKFGLPQYCLLRPAFARRSWPIERNAVLRRDLLIGDARATRYTLGCTINASASAFATSLRQTRDTRWFLAKRRCCLSKHPAASVCGRGRRLGAVRR